MRSKADYKEYSDNQLVDLLNKSDEQAFTEIMDRYYPLLYSFSKRRLQDKELTRDLVHDLFANLWEKRKALVIRGVLEAYLVQTIKYSVFNHYKHKLVEDKYVERFAKFMEDRENNADHLIRHNDLNALIEMEIAALPEKMRIVFELRRNKFMNKKEISEELNMPENTVKTNLTRALKILREKLPIDSATTILV